MKAITPLRAAVLAGAWCATCATVALAAPDKGATVYSKRHETKLLAEPKPLAAPAGQAGFAEPLKITEVRGLWYHVSGKSGAGWVFSGNVATEKPTLAPPAGFTSVSASDTSTVAAARPLTAVAEGYTERHNAGEAAEDLQWLEEQAAKYGPGVVNNFMKAQKKGEFQE